MSKTTTQPGSVRWRQIILLSVITILFTHGIFSSILLRETSCLQIMRILDIALVILLLGAAVLWPAKMGVRSILRTCRNQQVLRLFFFALITYSAWIVLSGALQGATLRETFLALLVDTALFWSFFAVVATQALSADESRRLLRAGVTIIGVLAGLALILYITKVHDNIDQWLGYGSCGTESILRTGGIDSFTRSRGFVRNPNELGALYVIPTALFISLAVTATRKRLKQLYIIGTAICSLLLLVTFSRSAWLATAAAVTLLVALTPRLRSLILNPRWLTAASVVVLLFAALLVSNPRLIDQVILHQSAESSSTSKHWAFKREGLSYVLTNPLGTGPGSAGAVGATLKDGPAINTESAYLDIGAQYGLIGLGLFGLLSAIIVRLLYTTKTIESCAILAGFGGLLFCGIFIPVLSNLTLTIFSGLMLGIGYLTTKRPTA